MKNKITIYIFILIAFIGLFNLTNKIYAQTPDTSNNQSYNLLEPIPDPTTNDGKPITDFPVGETGALGKYLNLAIKLFIGLCAVAAVVMIVIGGIEYSTSELISTKSAAKDRIQNAIFGLLLALGSYAILFTINPDLLNTEVDIGGATLTSSGEQVIADLKQNVLNENPTIPFSAVPRNRLEELGILCPESGGMPALSQISKSFVGKVSYNQNRRNTIAGGKLYTDCSAYVAQVYKCAGLSSPGGTTSGIFSSGNVSRIGSISSDGTSIDGIPLRVGDLLGWKAGDGGVPSGHVLMYIGNGQMINTTPGGVKIVNLGSYSFKSKLKYIKRI